MASGAGLNRVGQRGGKLLLGGLLATTAAVVNPQAGYGNIGLNDSGLVMSEQIGFSKNVFQVIGGPYVGTMTANLQITVYGTIDPVAYAAFDEPPAAGGGVGSTLVPASSWIPLPAPATESAGDTFQWSNPIIVGTFAGFSPVAALYNSAPFVAYRVVVTTAGAFTTTGTGYVSVIGFATP